MKSRLLQDKPTKLYAVLCHGVYFEVREIVTFGVRTSAEGRALYIANPPEWRVVYCGRYLFSQRTFAEACLTCERRARRILSGEEVTWP